MTTKEWQEGYLAFTQDIKISACPYPGDTWASAKRRFSWLAGWDDALSDSLLDQSPDSWFVEE